MEKQIPRPTPKERLRKIVYRAAVTLAVASLGLSSLPPIDVLAQAPVPIVVEGNLPIGRTAEFDADGNTHCFDFSSVPFGGSTDKITIDVVGESGPTEVHEGTCESQANINGANHTDLPDFQTDTQIEEMKKPENVRMEIELPPGQYNIQFFPPNTGETIGLTADSEGRILPVGKNTILSLTDQDDVELGNVVNNGSSDTTANVFFQINGADPVTQTVSLPSGDSTVVKFDIPESAPGKQAATLTICPEAFGSIDPDCEVVNVELTRGHLTYLPFVNVTKPPRVDPCDIDGNQCVTAAVVFGGMLGQNLREPIRKTAQYHAAALTTQLGDDNVHYLSADPIPCEENDPNVDLCSIDEGLVLNELKSFLDSHPPGLVLISYIDHGDRGGGLFFGFGNNVITPEELLGVLEEYPEFQFMFMAGTCHSGVMIDRASENYPGVIDYFVTSTDKGFAYVDERDDKLVDPFMWDMSDVGLEDTYSFLDAFTGFEFPQLSQVPQVEMNENGIRNEPEDFTVLDHIFLANLNNK